MDASPSPATTGRRRNLSGAARRAVVFAGFGCVVVIAGLIIAGHSLTKEFRHLEDNLARQQAIRMQMGLEADLRQLRVSNRDFAHWDDALRFVTIGKPEFPSTNFVYDTLANLEVDFVWIGGADGTTLYSALVDGRSRALVTPAPSELTRLIAGLPARSETLSSLEPSHSLLQTPLGIMAFAINRVTSSDGSVTTGTWMLFGRLLQADDISRAGENSHMQVALVPTANASQRAMQPAVLRVALNSSTQIAALPLDNRTVQSIAILRDFDGRPLAYLRSTMSRDISALGRVRTWGLLSIIGVVMLLFGTALFIALGRLRTSAARHFASEDRYRKITAQLQELLILADSQTFFVTEMNQAARSALGIELAHDEDVRLQDLFPNLDVSALIGASSTGLRARAREATMRRRDGTQFEVEFSVTSIIDRDQKLVCLSARDISEKRHAEEQRRENQRKLIHIAHHDQLTKLPNRLYLHTKLPQAIRKMSERTEMKLGLVYLDVDQFKNINDSHGHDCGDQLLQIIASRLRACVKMQDVVVRMGGDEFVIVAPMIQAREELDALARRVQVAIQAPMHVGNLDISTSTSMGIAVYPDDGREMDQLLKHADIALYQAKEAGRRCHRFFASDMNVRVSENLALEQALRHAVGTSQIHVEYQPVVALDSGRLVSLEALARWRHPELGVIPPGQFIPVAESSGLIVDLGEQVLKKVVKQLRAWIDAGLPIVPVAVNVSPLQLERTQFAAIARDLADTQGLEMKWLRFEITESALLKNPEQLIDTLQALRQMGSKILIDDFGTGYSSLNYLHRLPVDTVKIDRSFVTRLAVNGGNSAVVSAIVDMTRNLKLSTVAEGIETLEQHEWLLDLGCDMGQGYLYSKPVTASHCTTLFQNLGLERKLTETVLSRSLSGH